MVLTDGFGTFDVTIDDGNRQGVARHLDGIKNTNNLQIEHNTDVIAIIFENKRLQLMK